MRYAYNKNVNGFVNGVMFFFENGDDEIAEKTFQVISASKRSPTTIVWEGLHLTPLEALQMVTERNALVFGYLGVHLTVDNDEGLLLNEYLGFLKQNYPALLSLVKEIKSRVFCTRN